MQPTIRWMAALLLPALVATGTLIGAPKAADKDIDKTTDKMAKAGSVVGKVMNVYEDKKKIRIQVSYSIPKLNTGAYQQMIQAQRNMAMARDRQAYINAQTSYAQAQRTLYTNETKTKDLEIQAADDVVVRMARPKEDFDEKGKPKRYTKKELAELRGTDKKLPGYKAEFGDITTEQIIKIDLVRKKGTPPKPKKARGKDKDEAAEADLLGDFTPQASMIVIIREAAPPPK